MEEAMDREHNQRARRWMIGWLGGAAGGIGAVALAVTILIPWGRSDGAATPIQARNRIFADEAGYTATVTEYLALAHLGLDTAADEAFTYSVARQPAAPADCRMVLGSAVALCAPGEEANREQQVTRQLYGPR
jgi:hypothetical protein